MPVTVQHAHTATTPDITSSNYDILPQRDWNDTHAVTLSLSGTDIIGAFSNAGNVTFGTNLAGAVTATASMVIPAGLAISAGGNTAGTLSDVTGGTLLLAGGPNITLSQSGNSISFSGPTIPVYQLSNGNGVSFGTNGSTVTASVQTNYAGSGLTLSTTSGTALQGTLNSLGLELAVPPYLTTQTVQTQASGNIAGTGVTTTTQAGSTLGVTHNTAGLSLAIPDWVTNGGGVDISVGGNTSGALALISSGTLLLAGGNNITLSQNGNSVTISANTAAAANLSVSAGTNSGAYGGVTFSNSNNLSFGLNNGTITGTVSQSVQTQASGNIAATGFATTTAAGSVIAGTNNTAGLTLGVPAFLTTQTVQTQASGNIAATGFVTTSTNGSVIVGTNNTTGFTLGVPPYLTTYAQTTQTQASGNIAGTGVTTTTQGGSTLGLTLNTAGLSAAVPAWITAGGGGGIDISLGGNTTGTLALVSSGTLFLAGGNNVTLSQNANSITISANTAAAANLSVSAGTTSGAFGGLTFSNSNNVSFGLNNGTITGTATYSQSVQTQASGNIAATGFATTTTNGSVIVGTNNTTGLTLAVPPYLTTYAQSTQTQASGNIAGTGVTTTTQAGSTLGFTLNTAGLSVAAPPYITTYSQSVQTQASGNIAATGFATTTTNGSVIVGTNNTTGFTLGVPPYITTQSVQTQASGNIAGSGFTGTNATGTLNSLGLQISVGAGGGASTEGWYLAGNTTGQSSSSTYPISSLNVSFAGGMVSGGWSSNSLIISSPATTSGALLSAGISTVGNTSGNTGLASNQLVFAGGNNITLSGSTNGGSMTVTISGANAGGAQTGISGVQVSNTTYTSGTITFQNANGISFGSSGANGISASFSQSVQTQASGNIAATGFATTTTNGSVIVGTNNTTGFTLGVPPYITTYAQSTQTQASGSIAGIGVTTTTQAGSTLGASLSTNGLSLAIPAWITAGAGGNGVAVQVSNTTYTSGTVTFQNANGISFGSSGANGISASFSQSVQTQASGNIAATGFATTTTNGSVIVGTNNTTGFTLAVPPYLTTQSVQTQASGNIAGTGTSATGIGITLNSNGLAINNSLDTYNIVSLGTSTYGGGTGGATTSYSNATIGLYAGSNITLSQTSNSVIFYGGAGGGGGASSAGYFATGNTTNNSTTTLALSSQLFNFAGGVTGGFSNGSVQISAPPVSSLVGASNISVSTNGSTISVYEVLANNAVTQYVPWWPASTSSQTIAAMGVSTGSVFVFPLTVYADYAAADVIQILQSASHVSSTVAGSITHGSQFGIYTLNAGTLSQISSGSYSIGITESSGSATFSYPASTNSAGYTYSTTSVSASGQAQSYFGTVGNRQNGMVFGPQTFSQGLYWLAILATNSTNGFNGGLSTALVGNAMGAAQSATHWGQASSAGALSGALNWFWGNYTVTQINLPATLATSNISNTIAVMPMVTFTSV